MASYGTNLPPDQEEQARSRLLRPSERLDIPRSNDSQFPVARSVDHLLINNRSLSSIPRSDSSNAIRRPFVFNPRSRAESDADSDVVSNAEDYRRNQNMAIRYRLFNRLDPGGQTFVSA
jgi:hypothetical protein